MEQMRSIFWSLESSLGIAGVNRTAFKLKKLKRDNREGEKENEL